MHGKYQFFYSIVISLSAIAGLSSGCASDRSNFSKPNITLQSDSVLTPYLPDEELAAPNTPPSLIVAARRKPLLQPFYLDWSGAGGGMKEPPSNMHWSKIAQESTTLGWLETSQLPIRVVVYLYSQVNSAGIPDEGAGSEYRCTQTISQQVPCTYSKVRHLGKPAVELVLNDKSDDDTCYIVVYAGWIVPQSQPTRSTKGGRANNNEVGASWAWHRCKDSPS